MSTSALLAATDPFVLFEEWFREAQASEPNDPNAVALATASSDGYPTVRMVLAKPTNGHPFCFYTNAQSSKGLQLTQNPRAALCFHWKSLRRQVRVEGTITELDPASVDAYFHSRGRLSQISAAISSQSRPAPSRAAMEERAATFAQQHPGEIPRPAHWTGYHLHPHSIEFWIDGPHRLHDRYLFTLENGAWQQIRLYP